ncbi:NTP pyrophosphatase (non-canonical NTP hydrolase) [Bradyrhizobium sp. USDA 4341]
MAEVDNETRAGWAEEALRTFMFQTRLNPGEADNQEALGDLLGDLCHLARKLGMDPVDTVRKGLAVFLDEEHEVHGEHGPEVEIRVGPPAPCPTP